MFPQHLSTQPIPKLYQTHLFIPWIIWQQFSSKQVLSSSFPSIILPPVVFMYPAFILFHLLSFTPVSLCRRGDDDSFSNFSPHFPVKGSCHHWQFYSQMLRENSMHQQPPRPCQGLPELQHLTQHHCLLTWINAIGSSPLFLEKPRSAAGSHLPGLAAALFGLAGLTKGAAKWQIDWTSQGFCCPTATSPTRAKSTTFSSEDATCEGQW